MFVLDKFGTKNMTNAQIEEKIYNPNGKLIFDGIDINSYGNFIDWKHIEVSNLKKISERLKQIGYPNINNLSYWKKQEILSWKKGDYTLHNINGTSNLENIKNTKNFYGTWLGAFYVNGKNVDSVQADVKPAPK